MIKLKNKIDFKILGYKLFHSILLLFIFNVFLLSLITYNEFDPSPFSVGEEEVSNFLGPFGANISAVLFFIYGQGVWLLLLGCILLSRLIIISNSYMYYFFPRLFFIFILTFLISLSLENFSYNPGMLGKAFLFKFNKYLIKHELQFQSYLSIICLLFFAFLYLVCVSKNLKSLINAIYNLFKSILMMSISLIKFFFKKRKVKLSKQKKNEIRKKPLSKLKNLSFNLPLISFLDTSKLNVYRKNDNIENNAKELEKVLDDYGIKGDIVDVTIGPIVTRYELEPAPGTRSSRVISLSDDIARSMSAKSARVSVIYGKNAIGIELPNKNIEKVFLKDIVSSTEFSNNKGIILALGKDISGKPITTDLSKMPHILIAGTTGSGKSVAINAMILSLLYNFTPDECKLILIDPKMLELSVYEDIPHLLHPVVTDPRKAIHALKWAVKEMNERYKHMATLGVRNIDSYNKIVSKKDNKQDKIFKKVQVGFDSSSGKPIYQQKQIELNLLPFLVIIVDEMADLMLTAGKEIEISIQSLAQKARAAGIHLVLATQRPSVDVITGTIKANLPYRISFQVTSKIDSRTILGEQGAEQLLGKGDMLFMAGGGFTERIHGPFVSDQEILKVVEFIKAQSKPEYLHHITEDTSQSEEDLKNDIQEQDPLYEKALSLIIRENKISTSFLQRHFAIGYNRAARIVDAFEKQGIVSSPNAMGRREILTNRDD